MYSAFRAAAAAVATPLYIASGRWRSLLEPASASAASPDSADHVFARRVAAGGVTRLARIPFSPWRSTCLYRAVSVCLMLRWSNVPAVLRVGVRSAREDGGDFTAHAWVENLNGELLYERRGDYVTLR